LLYRTVQETNPIAHVIGCLRDATSTAVAGNNKESIRIDNSRKAEAVSLVEMRKRLNSGNSTGILINLRFSNLPMPLMSALHSQLLEDLLWAQQLSPNRSNTSTITSTDETNNAGVDFSIMTHVVALCSCTLLDKSAYDTGNGRVCEVTGGGSGLVFDQFEDEVYFQSARCAFLFRSSKTPENAMCLASLLPLTSLRSCVDKIKLLCGSS
jgi:hypothetical protein